MDKITKLIGCVVGSKMQLQQSNSKWRWQWKSASKSKHLFLITQLGLFVNILYTRYVTPLSSSWEALAPIGLLFTLCFIDHLLYPLFNPSFIIPLLPMPCCTSFRRRSLTTTTTTVVQPDGKWRRWRGLLISLLISHTITLVTNNGCIAEFVKFLNVPDNEDSDIQHLVNTLVELDKILQERIEVVSTRV